MLMMAMAMQKSVNRTIREYEANGRPLSVGAGQHVGVQGVTSIMIEAPDAPLVSVIIPCYNQARYLPDAIKSASAQTHSRVQIVVVDDGSVDNTAEVASFFPDVWWVRQRNQGVAEARNAGFLHSS